MHNILSSQSRIIIVLLATVCLAIPAAAQRGTGEPTGIARQGLKPPIEVLSGTIKDIKIGRCEKTTGRSPEGAHLIVQAPDATMINLHLGPAFALREELKQLSVGQSISFGLLDVSNGIENLAEWGSDEVDHGDEGVDVAVAARPGTCCLEDSVERLKAGVAVG